MVDFERVGFWFAVVLLLLAGGILLFEPPLTEETAAPWLEMYAHQYACAQWHQDERGVFDAAVKYNDIVRSIHGDDERRQLPPHLVLDPYLAEAVKESGDCGYHKTSPR